MGTLIKNYNARFIVLRLSEPSNKLLQLTLDGQKGEAPR